jgi:hypothetical protein
MLGIPTRSDVTDPEYLPILKKYNLLSQLPGHDNVFLNSFLYNHVSHAYRQSGEELTRTERHNKFISPVSENILELLNPQGVFQYYINDIDKILKTVNIVESALDQNKRYQLLQLLSSLKTDLSEAYNSSTRPEIQLTNMWNVFEKYEKVRILHNIHTDAINLNRELRDLELHKPEVNTLYAKNLQIRSKSDVHLTFNESFIDCHFFPGFYGIPTDGTLFNVDKYLREYTGLYSRISIRDFIEFIIGGSNGRVRINGVEYNSHNGMLLTSVDPFQEIVNIIAIPVRFAGKTIEPEQWVIKENQMVKDFRNGVIGPDEVLSQYVGFGNPLTDSENKILDYVKHTFEKRIFEKQLYSQLPD